MDRDIVCGVIGFAIALLYLYAAESIPESVMGDTVGAGGVPHLLGSALVAVSLLFVGQRIVALRTGRGNTVESESRGVFDHPVAAFLTAGGATLICAVFIFIFEPIGYVPAMVFLLLGMGLYQGIRPSLRLLAISVGGAVTLWAIFVLLLAVHMPVGIWLDLF